MDINRLLVEMRSMKSQAQAFQRPENLAAKDVSISRAMPNIVPKSHLQLMQRFKQTQSLYQDNRDLITIGAYRAGSDPAIDRAIERNPHMKQFVRQDLDEAVMFEQSSQQLQALMAPLVQG